MATLLNPFLRADDANGNPVSGGQLAVFEAGTTTPVTTYSDRALSTAQARPLIANSAGEFAQSFVEAGIYKIRVSDASGVTLYENDNVRIADRPDDPVFFDTRAEVLAGTETYTEGTRIIALDDGSNYIYVAAASGATDHDVTNAGGQKLYYSRRFYETVAQLLASTEVSRGEGKTWVAGGFRYTEAASGASDQHVTTAGGVKLYVLPEEYGYDVRAFGAIIDGTTDASAEVQAAADAAVADGIGLGSPQIGTLYLASEVDLKGIKYIDFKSDILVDPAIVGVPVTVGGRAQVIGGRWEFNRVSDGTSFITGTPPSRPILRIAGSKSIRIEIGSCQYVQFYSDETVNSGASNAYNSVFLHGAVYKMEFFGEPGISWVNENFIYGGRIKKLIVDGTNYGHNHNKFINNTFEGSDVDIQFLGTCHVNSIYGARFEGANASSGITFGAGSYSNYVEQSYSGVGDPRNQFLSLVPVSDSGEGNAVFTEAASKFCTQNLLKFGRGNLVLGTSNSSWSDAKLPAQPFGAFDGSRNTLIPELNGVSWVFSTRYIFSTDYVPVSLGDVVRMLSDYEGSLLRLHIYVFDSDMKPLTSEGGAGNFITALNYSFSSSNGYGYYSRGSDASDIPVAISVSRSEVAFIKIAVYGTPGVIREFSLDLLYNPIGRPFSESSDNKTITTPVLSGTPTRGYAPRGVMVYETGTPSTVTCTYAHETLTSGVLSAGSTSVTVSRIQSVANGDVCGILMDSGSTHWTTVSSLSGSTFTIGAIPSGESVASGSRIVFNRWA